MFSCEFYKMSKNTFGGCLKIKTRQIYMKIWKLIDLKVLNTNLTGFNFSQNGLSELINLCPPWNHWKITELQG